MNLSQHHFAQNSEPHQAKTILHRHRAIAQLTYGYDRISLKSAVSASPVHYRQLPRMRLQALPHEAVADDQAA